MTMDNEFDMEELQREYQEDIRMIEARIGLFYISMHHMAGITTPHIIMVCGPKILYEEDSDSYIEAVLLSVRCYPPNGDAPFETDLYTWDLSEKRWYGSKEAAFKAYNDHSSDKKEVEE
jgi:hypothetical protein